VSSFFRTPAPRRVDLGLVTALAIDAALLVWLSWNSAHVVAGLALAALAAAGGLWCASRPVDRWYVRPGFAAMLVALVLAQVAVADNPRPWALNVFLTLSLLPSLQRPWLVLATGTAFGVGGLLLFVERGLLAAMTEPPGLVFLAFVGAQTLLLAHVARRNGQRGEERFDIEFLVRAMGSDGPIRLDLDAVRAESALGERLKHVQQRMADAIRQAHVAARDVREASQELDGSGEALRERTERSAAGLRDAALTLEQITATVQTSARAALEARSMAASASQQAVQGGELFDQVTQRMQDIDKASRRITDVIGVIDGIAFQTNILALNAAVEAARAGEQGRGFAVVAAEVRNLALRAGTAAAEIKTLIGASIETVRSGNELVDAAGQRMGEIVESVRKVGEVFVHLSADTNEHAGSIEAVTRSVKGLDAMTRQNVAVAETSQRIARALLDQGAQLEQVLCSFKLGAEPPAAVAVQPPAPPVTPPTSASAKASQARKLASTAIRAAAQPRRPVETALTRTGGDAGNVTHP